MADSNRQLIQYSKESTYGVAPTGAYNTIPFSSHTLRPTSDRQEDDTIRADGQRLEPQQLSIGAEGDIVSRVKYGTLDDWLASALRHSTTWQSSVAVMTADTTISINATTGIITLGTGVWDNTPAVGSWIRLTGPAAAGNASVFKVSAATTTTITVTNKEGMVTASSGDAITIVQGAMIENGVQKDSYSIEGQHLDLSTPLFPLWVGMALNRWRFNMAIRSFASMTFSFIGKKETSPIPTSTIAGSQNAYTDKPSMQCVDNVLKAQYKALGVELTEFNIEIDNGIGTHEVLGELGAKRFRLGSFTVTGNVKAYFQDATLVNDFLANTSGSLALVLKDSDTAPGNIYVMDIPSMKFATGPRDNTGLNSDVMVDLQVQGFRNAAEDQTMRIVRFPNS